MNIQKIFALIGILGLLFAGLFAKDWDTRIVGVLLAVANYVIFLK